VGQAFFLLLFLSSAWFLFLSFRPAQIQQAGKKEGVWGGNFCQRLLSRKAGVSVYAPPPSSLGGANIIVFARKKFEQNRANTTKMNLFYFDAPRPRLPKGKAGNFKKIRRNTNNIDCFDFLNCRCFPPKAE
jgi:hypothetical protein